MYDNVVFTGGTLPYYNHGSPAYLSYLSLLTNAAAAAAAAAGGTVYQPPSQLVPGSPFPSPSSAGCCTPGTRPDVSPSFDFSSPFHPLTTHRLLDLQKGRSSTHNNNLDHFSVSQKSPPP